MPDTATALLIEVQADGLARECVLSAQLYSANEPLLVPKPSSPTWNPVTFGSADAIGIQPGNRYQFQAHPRLPEPGAREPHPTW